MTTRLSTVAWLVALALLLGACSAADESAGSDGEAGSSAGANPAGDQPVAAAPPAPDWDEVRAKMADGLVPDRDNARYTSETIPRQSEELDPPAQPR